MKILVLTGSNRRHGNTDQILAQIAAHLRTEAERCGTPLEIETVLLGQQDLRFCRGCRLCYDRGEDHCPVKDDLPALKAKMQAADGIVLASPVYVDDVSGITKAFIDRLCHLCHRPEFASKAAILVATTGSSPTSKTLGTMKLALRTWGFYIAGQSGFKMGVLMKPAETRQRFDAQTGAIAHRLFQAIETQAYRRPGFYALMMFKIQQHFWQTEGVPGTPDYDYWLNQGWFDPKQTFYIPHTANPVKVALARLTGALISRFVS
jgi:multimeric flavodoxin WrbA